MRCTSLCTFSVNKCTILRYIEIHSKNEIWIKSFNILKTTFNFNEILKWHRWRFSIIENIFNPCMCIYVQNINMTETINLHKYFYYAFGSSQHMQDTDDKSLIIFNRPILEVIQIKWISNCCTLYWGSWD